MHDNILISHELTHIINKQSIVPQHLAPLNLDMKKAYDLVSWLSILKILIKAYGFSDQWIHLVHQCTSTVSYDILINGAVMWYLGPNVASVKAFLCPLTCFCFA